MLYRLHGGIAIAKLPIMARRGISLIELIFVMAIITLLLALSIPKWNQMINSTQLLSAGNKIVDTLVLAKQSALTLNSSIEFRVYKLPLPGGDETHLYYRAIQLMQLTNSSASSSEGTSGKIIKTIPLTVVQFLPGSSILTEENEKLFSTLLTLPERSEYISSFGHNGEGRFTHFISFIFLPNGATSLDSGIQAQWTFTVKSVKDPVLANKIPARDFITIQVEPLVSSLRIYRP